MDFCFVCLFARNWLHMGIWRETLQIVRRLVNA